MENASRKTGPIGLDLFLPDARFGELFSDLYSAVSRRDGEFARVAWRVPLQGVVHVLAVERGSLPKGTGGRLIAEALTLSNTLPTRRLIIEEIINPPTLDAYAAGGAPESTVLGKAAVSALDQMGLCPSRCAWDVGQFKMRMVIDIDEYQLDEI